MEQTTCRSYDVTMPYSLTDSVTHPSRQGATLGRLAFLGGVENLLNTQCFLAVYTQPGKHNNNINISKSAYIQTL